jgi:hypothetical protein
MFSLSASGQATSYKKKGQPLLTNPVPPPPGFTQPPYAVVDAYVYNNKPTNPNNSPCDTHNLDACSLIHQAFVDAQGAGVYAPTIDARGMTGNWNCSMSPIPPATSSTTIGSSGRLLLGNINVCTTATWTIPAGAELDGLGALSTTIQAASGFTGTNVIAMGAEGVGGQFGVKIKGLTIDCNGSNNTSCTGIYNDVAEEGSSVEDVNISNAPTFGLDIYVTASSNNPPTPYGANSGSYRNITIANSACSNCNTNTVGVKINGANNGRIVRGLENITVSATCGIGILVYEASTRISNSTITCTSDDIEVQGGSSSAQAADVQIENVYLGGGSATLGIWLTSNTSDIVISNANKASSMTTLLEDDVSTPVDGTMKINDSFLGFYMRGDCCATSGSTTIPPALATSALTNAFNSTNITWEAPNGFTAP